MRRPDVGVRTGTRVAPPVTILCNFMGDRKMKTLFEKPAGRARRGAMAGLAVMAMGTASLAVASPAHANPSTANVVDRPATTGVTADALPTTQIDGVAWSQKIIGNTVYVGGEFANARPAGAAAGTSQTPRHNVLAYDLTTGQLKANFRADTNGAVKIVAASPDGSRIYIGGNFTTVQGQTRTRLAAINTADGSLVPGFAPVLNGTVRGITVTSSAVYAGGDFTTANGVARQHLAALSPDTGATLGWAPTTDSPVWTMVATPDQSHIIIGGTFSSVNGSVNPGSASVDAATGATSSWAFNRIVSNSGTNAGIYNLSTDGTNIMATAFSYQQAGFEGPALINPNGHMVWMADCHGDSYGAAAMQNLVYVSSHSHSCENIGNYATTTPTTYNHATAFTYNATTTVRPNREDGYANFSGNPAPTQVDFFPHFTVGSFTGASQATWNVAANSNYVVYGGEFPTVNNKAQQGLVRFAVPSIAPRKVGPSYSGTDFPLKASVRGTVATLSWQTNLDRDNEALDYRIYRSDNPNTPIATVSAKSLWWDRPTVTWTDASLAASTTYTYSVVAVDPDGNQARSADAQVTSAAPSPSDTYLKAVLASNPTHLWRLDEGAFSSVAADRMGTLPMTTGIGVGRNVSGAMSGDSASSFDGLLGGWAFSNQTEAAPTTYSAELWAKTSSSRGGVILDLGNAQRFTSSKSDRQVYFTNNGRLAFSLATANGRVAVTSTRSYNDGKWHHIAVSVSASGMQLYVDGTAVASNTQVTQAQPMTGYWRLGGDSPSGLPNQPSATWTSASLDEVATYSTPLDAATVAAHAKAGNPTLP